MDSLRTVAKALGNLACVSVVWPIYYGAMPLAFLTGRDGVFSFGSQALSIVPGLIGDYIRRAFYHVALARCPLEGAIQFGTIFSKCDTEIGIGVYIGAYCNIGRCCIEDHCTLGSGVHILSGRRQHNFDDLETPLQHQGGTFEKIVIGQDTWIGNCAVVMANVGRKCIVGAGAVVTKDVDDYAIVAGNPARVVGCRGALVDGETVVSEGPL